MPTSRLSRDSIRKISEPGRYGDGGGLFLLVNPGGSRQWMARLTINGKRRDLGLGAASPDCGGRGTMTLDQARKAAARFRDQAQQGIDPKEQEKAERAARDAAARDAAARAVTFRDAAERVHRDSLAIWKNGKHRDQWITTLRSYAFPVIGDMAVGDVGKAQVIEILAPIWIAKPETARRVRQRIETVLEWATANEYRTGENPVAAVKRMKSALPKQPKTRGHHAAMPWQEVPAFVARLDQAAGLGALALRFAILTASRSGEVRGMRWAEIDRQARLWTIPAERMKAGRVHRVPLCDAALALLEAVQGLGDDLVFPGQRPGQPLSDMTLTGVLRRMDLGHLTVHGFRSTFRDWCGERAGVSWEVAEAALAHQVGNATERAYARSDYLDQRRDLMARWAAFCVQPGGTIVDLRARG